MKVLVPWNSDLKIKPPSSNINMKNFSTIAIFSYPAEYAVIQHLFDQEEIRYFFTNETMVSVFPFYSNAVGGIRLNVHNDDVEFAQEILRKFNDTNHLKIV